MKGLKLRQNSLDGTLVHEGYGEDSVGGLGGIYLVGILVIYIYIYIYIYIEQLKNKKGT